jgi:hypothetical protein
MNEAERIEELEAENQRYRATLERIERWQFPATGKFHEDGTPKRWAYCYGSNGERDYMRRIAREALAATEAAPDAL